MKIKVWCDNGANIHSKRQTIIDTEKMFGYDDDEWSRITDEEKDEMLNQVVMDWFNWGWSEE